MSRQRLDGKQRLTALARKTKLITREMLDRMVEDRARLLLKEIVEEYEGKLASLESGLRKMKTQSDINKEILKGAADELAASRAYPQYMMRTVMDFVHRLAVAQAGILNADKVVNRSTLLQDIPYRFLAVAGGLAFITAAVFTNQGLYKWASTFPGEYEFVGFVGGVLVVAFLVLRRPPET